MIMAIKIIMIMIDNVKWRTLAALLDVEMLERAIKSATLCKS